LRRSSLETLGSVAGLHAALYFPTAAERQPFPHVHETGDRGRISRHIQRRTSGRYSLRGVGCVVGVAVAVAVAVAVDVAVGVAVAVAVTVAESGEAARAVLLEAHGRRIAGVHMHVERRGGGAQPETAGAVDIYRVGWRASDNCERRLRAGDIVDRELVRAARGVIVGGDLLSVPSVFSVASELTLSY
jgi:hypothetical protein